MRLDATADSGQPPESSEPSELSAPSELSELSEPSSLTTALAAPRAGFFSTVRLALLRASQSCWLLLVVALGILVADVLICTVPLYNTLVSNVQLQNAIATSAGVKSNMQVSVQTSTVNQSLQDQADAIIRKTQRQYLGGVSKPTPMTYINADVSALAQLGSQRFENPVGEVRARMETADFATIAPYLHFIAGNAPQNTAPGKPIQLAVTQDMAFFLHAALGQQIVFANLNETDQRVTGVIVGVFEQKDRNDPFWNGRTFDLEGGLDTPTVYPVLTTTENFYGAFTSFTGLDMTQTWVYYTRLDQITTSNMGAVAEDFQAFRAHAITNVQVVSGVLGTTTLGNFDQIIANLQRQLGLIALPLYVIAAQIVGLALLFVAAMASILIERQSQGIATLKSRGMSPQQLLGVFGVQSALLAVIAIILGPLLAAGLAALLVRLFLSGGATFGTRVGSAYFTGAASPLSVIAPAIIGGALGMAVVTVSAWQAARLDVLAFRRELARPSRPPFWRRAYLDVGLALLCAVGYLELGQFGGTQTRLALGDSGGQSISPLLLLTPALLLLAGGLLLLRVVPLAARLGTWLASRGRGLTTLLAFAQIERTPGRYARLTLLLTLAVGLGLFALVFDASLTQNVHDSAAYTAGADMRISLNPPVSLQQQAAYTTQLRALPGVEDTTALYRTYGSTSQDLGNLGVDILGVDPATFAGVANSFSWRSDYAAQSLPDLMRQMRAGQTRLDAGTEQGQAPPIWAIASDGLAQEMRLKVGQRFHLDISDVHFGTPTFVVGAIFHDFPTLYPQQAPGGVMVVDMMAYGAYVAAHSDQAFVTSFGPNEFWLRTTTSQRQHQALLDALDRQRFTLSINSVDSFQEDLAQAQANPTNSGMRGLLLIGALTAAFLAVLGTLVQAIIAARQRTTQFAIFRTLGMASRQLTGLLLGEQTVVYLFGLFGGTLLGLLLTTATAPFLTFSAAAVDPTTVGVPPYALRINWPTVGLFYGALLLAFALALVIAARYAATIGLGKALRLGED